MNAPRIIPAGPMGLEDILPLIREVGQLRERGHYPEAAELKERIRQPITVAGRVLECSSNDSGFAWHCGEYERGVSLMVIADSWRAVVTLRGPGGVSVQTQGAGPTIAAALADAQERYQAAIADTLLRMGGLLREVVL